MGSKVLKAVGRAFDLHKDPEGNEVKQSVIDVLLADRQNRILLTAMAGLCGKSIEDHARKLRPEGWPEFTEKQKHDFMEEHLPELANRENLQEAFNLIWLGCCIGLGMGEEVSKENPDTDMVDKAMQQLDIGKGVCQLCGEKRHLKALGPNGKHICRDCADKDPASATDEINKKLKEIGGDKAPIAIHASVLKGGGSVDEIKRVVETAITNHFNPQDIKKFN